MSNALAQQYNKLSSQFLAVSLREQVLILICGLVVVILLMYTFLLEPSFKHSKKLQRNTMNAEKEIANLAGQVTQFYDKLKDDPNIPVNEKIKVLERQVQNIVKQLESQTNNLVPANKMVNMLESVLASSQGVKLVELQSITPIPILSMQSEEGGEPKVDLYRHGVTLIFEGSYFAIQQYLEKLETLPWQFYWKKFDYLVGDYPTASVELEIYTLSTNKAFIGV